MYDVTLKLNHLNIGIKSVNYINNYLQLKNINLSITCAMCVGGLSYGVLNNRSFQFSGFAKEQCGRLFNHANKESIIICEETYNLIQEENTITQLNVDLQELANMNEFIRCKVNVQTNDADVVTANNILQRFCNLG